MDHSHLRHFLLLLLLLLLIATALSIPSSASADGLKPDEDVAKRKHRGSPVEWAIGETTAAFNSRWDAIWTRAKLAWLNLRSPGPSRSDRSGSGVKEAATKSFKASKETVEEAARSAAELAEEAVEKTKEKLKRTVSKPDLNAEL